MKIFSKIILLSALVAFVAVPAFAEMSAEELAAESVAYLKTTQKTTPTMPDTIVGKVEEACKVLTAEGAAGFPKFMGKDSAFLYEGTYIWIHTLKDAKMLMHPVKHKMVGKNLIGLKDQKGKRFFVTMNDVAGNKGQGWVEYFWPIPGTKDIVRKVSFVKKCTMSDGTDIVIGSGIYNGDKAAMDKLEVN